MRKVLLYILLLSCLPVCLSAQVAYMEEKAKVNKIKRSPYISMVRELRLR